ncbi:MAG: radical SAM protein [Acidobacteria bacterium]|nr:radical SAM protein [Acidobacteriota bacterium]
MQVLLLSTYDMGRQPFGLASPAAWLREAGIEVACADLSKDRLPQEAVRAAGMIAFFLPMHTATRLALPVIDRVRGLNSTARLVAYGLYAPLNAPLLRDRGVEEILGGEFEAALVEIASRGTAAPALATASALPTPSVARLKFKVPDRAGLPTLSRYAGLQVDGEKRVAGYTEASRGCKHRCRHCPIVPVYDGRFRIVAPEIVLADARAQVAAGARHITFGDPDFFNGIRHARAVVEGFARELPGVTYDVTIKVEHLLQHADALPLLRATGCAFITSAVEAVDDRVLGLLEKGHSRADFQRAVTLCARVGVPLSPTFVAFTPWTTIESYRDFLGEIDRLNLVEHVAPIQYAIRLLVTDKSRLLELDEIRRLVKRFDPVSLTYPWVHPDPQVDRLHATVSAIVGVRTTAPRADVFARVWAAAHADAEKPLHWQQPVLTARAAIPYLTEPWYC